MSKNRKQYNDEDEDFQPRQDGKRGRKDRDRERNSLRRVKFAMSFIGQKPERDERPVIQEVLRGAE